MYDLNKKFIFTHPPKCGGTSIESILGFLALRETYPQVHAFKHGSLEMHVDTIKLKNFSEDEFFKFSIIRNPWDRAVSFYNHNKYKEFNYYANEAKDKEIPKHVKDSKEITFKQFAFKYFKINFNSDVVTKPFMFLQEKFSLDHVLKLESINDGLFSIKDKLKINSDLNIPHLNNTDEYTIRENYQKYYDNETKYLIQDLFKWDIETFGYKFD
jgi:chondroitin 4-sulfotransferase 11